MAGSGLVRAAVDIGTNSVRLLVAEVRDGAVMPLKRELVSTRLGQGLSDDGLLQDEPQQRTLAALSRFAAVLTAFGPAATAAVATSAVREAKNGREFAAAASKVLGTPVRVIDGAEEARLSYLGAVQALGLKEAVVVDIGGGSTELTYPHGGRLVSHSCPVGAVRCTARGATRAAIAETLRPATADVPAFLPLVGVGGTVTSLVAVEKGLVPYDPAEVHGTRLSAETVAKLHARLAGLDLARRRQVPGLQPERADIILAGTLILQEILAQLGRDELIVSEADLLYALILEMVP